jgi:hypothetical protein
MRSLYNGFKQLILFVIIFNFGFHGILPRKVVLAVIMSARGFRLFMIPGSWGAVPVISGIRKLQKKTRHIGGLKLFLEGWPVWIEPADAADVMRHRFSGFALQ